MSAGIRGKQAGHSRGKLIVRQIENVVKGNARQWVKGKGEITAGSISVNASRKVLDNALLLALDGWDMGDKNLLGT